MLRTIRSRIVFVNVVMIVAMTLVVVVTTQINYRLELTRVCQGLAEQSLESARSFLGEEYDDYVSHKLGSIVRRRELMVQMCSELLVLISEMNALVKSGLLSEETAQRMVTDGIDKMAHGNRQYFFVCDMNLRGIAHPQKAMIGRKWTGYQDMKKRDSFLTVKETVLEEGSAFTVFEWPFLQEPLPIKQMGFFMPFPEWGWIVGTSVRIDDLERESHEKLQRILTRAREHFAETRSAEKGRRFLFDGKGNLLVCPERTSHSVLDTATIANILSTAQRSEYPFIYSADFSDKRQPGQIIYVQYFRTLDWYVGVSISWDDVKEPITSLIIRQIYILAVLLGVAVVSAMLLSRSLARPLEKLATYARCIPEKKLSSKVDLPVFPDSYGIEVYALSQAIAFMDTELRRQFTEIDLYRQHLESLVNDRTSELTRVNEVLQLEIADHKLVQEALQESEAQKTAILNGITISIAFLTPDLKIVWLNKTAAESSKNAQEEIVGRRCYELWAGRKRPCRNCPALRAVNSRRPEHAVLTTRDGVSWNERGEPVFNTRGELIGVVEIAEDITMLKEAERKRERLQLRLWQASKAESLARMAGAIAHHFNNQLAVVIGRLELALLHGLPPGARAREDILEAMKAAKRSAEISGFMLTYLGQTEGKQELINLSEACGNSLALLQDTIPRRIIIDTDFMAFGTIVCASTAQMQQVMTHLITNAVEAIGEDDGQVKVGTGIIPSAYVSKSHLVPHGWRPTGDSLAFIEVTDSGCGIAKEDVDRIFDPFFTTKFTGRGLGLAVVLGIVKAWKGAVCVEDREGCGSCFRIYLPSSDDALSCNERKPTVALPMASGGMVLLVEDQDMVRCMAQTMLDSLGFSVLTAASGAEAIELFRHHQHEIRCVITDLTMPGMDGWETIAALRRIQPGVPIVLSSGYDESQIMADGHSERPHVFLQKPYTAATLKAAVAEALEAPPVVDS